MQIAVVYHLNVKIVNLQRNVQIALGRNVVVLLFCKRVKCFNDKDLILELIYEKINSYSLTDSFHTFFSFGSSENIQTTARSLVNMILFDFSR